MSTTLTATPGPRDLQATVLGTGTIDGSGILLAAGESGSDITGIQYRSSTTYGTVTATVSNGYFALWLPGTELENTPSNGLPVEVAYRDGTTATVLTSLSATESYRTARRVALRYTQRNTLAAGVSPVAASPLQSSAADPCGSPDVTQHTDRLGLSECSTATHPLGGRHFTLQGGQLFRGRATDPPHMPEEYA